MSEEEKAFHRIVTKKYITPWSKSDSEFRRDWRVFSRGFRFLIVLRDLTQEKFTFPLLINLRRVLFLLFSSHTEIEIRKTSQEKLVLYFYLSRFCR